MRLPTHIVDKFAVETPHEVWVKIPTNEPLDGNEDGALSWQNVTWSQLSRAVDTMAHWIDTNLGPRPDMTTPGEWPVVTYMGTNDIRYPIFMLAAMKTRYIPFLTSPRNSQQAHLSLLRATNSQIFVYTPEFTSTVSSLTPSLPHLAAFQIPPLAFFLNPLNHQKFSSPAQDIPNSQTLLIVHSGGTTSPLGIPTPISLKAGIFPIIESLTSMPCPKGRTNVSDDLYGTDLMLTALPAFHIMGINLLLGRSIYHRKPLVLLPGDRPPTTDMVLRGLETTRATSVMLAPSMIADIWREDTSQGREMLSRLESIHYGGACLDRQIGDDIAQVTRLINGIGSTETFSLATYIPLDPADWEYFEWNLDGTGIVMEPFAEGSDSNLFELVIKRQEDPDKAKWQFIFQNFPDLTEWRMGDLYEPHPDAEKRGRLWRSVGRKDDIVVLSNGEKVNPTGFETLVGACPLVKGVVMVGMGRFQTGVVIQLVDYYAKKETALDEIWRWIERGNKELPSHARVWRSMVTFAVPEKPFVRSGKGAVVRRATVALYECEIGMLYGKRERDDPDGEEEEDQSEQDHNIDGALDGVREAVRSVLGSLELRDEKNLFQLGLDSLQALELSRALTRRFRHLQGSTSRVTRMIYENSSIITLAHAIHKATSTSQTTQQRRATISREERMSRMVHKYTASLPQTANRRASLDVTLNEALSSTNNASDLTQGYKVLLTGSTGSLGTYLLHSLLQNSQVSHIYCLNRSPDAAERQTQSVQERGLETPLSFKNLSKSGEEYPTPEQSPPRDNPESTETVTPDLRLGDHPDITFLTSPDLSQTCLGLDNNAYNSLVDDGIDLIIHNAWPVNFNSPLEEFEPAVAGVSRLVDFVADSASSTSAIVHMVFISSVASVMNYPAVRGNDGYASSKDGEGAETLVTIPEEFDPDNSLPAKQGYGESKHVASCILTKAVNGSSSMKPTIIRVGQLAGSTDGRGIWGRHEWFPSLVETSKNMGKIPTSLGCSTSHENSIDWLPVDIAARSILELALSRLHPVSSERESQPALATFNLVNPATANWKEIMATVKEYYSSKEGVQLKDVSYREWLTELSEMGNGTSSLCSNRNMGEISRKYPAIKLQDFFQGLSSDERVAVKFSTDRAVASSKTLAEARAVDREMVTKWLAGWDF